MKFCRWDQTQVTCFTPPFSYVTNRFSTAFIFLKRDQFGEHNLSMMALVSKLFSKAFSFQVIKNRIIQSYKDKVNFKPAFPVRPCQANLSFNPFPNKPWFLRVYSTSLLKTLWENEKLLVTSNFSFSHSVFNLFGELTAICMKFEIIVSQLCEFGRV